MRLVTMAVGLIAGGSAQAAEVLLSDAAVPEHVQTQVGAAATLGGGLAFQDDGTGGTWTVRGIYGTRSIVGLEAAYVGSARDLEANRTLLTNGGEVAVRAALPLGTEPDNRTVVAPFLYAGLGYAWTEVLVDEADNPRDDGAYVPAGGGIAVSYDQFYIDGRATWHEPLIENLPGGGDEGQLLLSANVGAEF